METHLTEQQLIDGLFDLAEPEAAEQIAAHVDHCARCRAAQERLQQKFSALDLLQGDPQVSDELLQRITSQTARPRRRLLRPWWLGVAAVLALGFFIVALHRPQKIGFVPTQTIQAIQKMPAAEVSRTTRSVVSMKTKAPSAAPVSTKLQTPPPFAPASAIELVTLPRRENVQLTIYNAADLTLVREQRHLTLKKGWNWLQFMWANTLIDPTSLDLEPLLHSDEISVEQLVYPAGLKDVGRWLIRSDVEGQVPFTLTYFTSGLTWRAFYMGTLSQDETTLSLKNYVRIDNQSGEDFEKAKTRLVLGNVNVTEPISTLAQRQYPFNRPSAKSNRSDLHLYDSAYFDYKLGIADKSRTVEYGWQGRLAQKKVLKQSLSEYTLYTIEGRENLTNKWGQRLLSLKAEDIPVTSLYQYDESRWGHQTQRFVSFANDTQHKLGQTPLPQGQVKLYGRAGQGLNFVSDADLKYIPVNEKVELHLGPARYVKVKPILMQEETADYRFDKQGNVAGWDRIEHWRINITNTRNLPIDIEITRDFATSEWTLTGAAYEKYDAQKAQFKRTIAKESKETINYIFTTYHGTRAEEFEKQLQQQNRSPITDH